MQSPCMYKKQESDEKLKFTLCEENKGINSINELKTISDKQLIQPKKYRIATIKSNSLTLSIM